MPRNGSGQYNPLTNTWNPPVTGVLATGADFQAQLNDISAAITQSVSKDGQTPMTANLPMGNNSIVGIASGAAAAPSISPINDTNTGLYFPAADTVGVAVGGVNVGNFTSAGFGGNLVNGNATLAAGTAAAPSITTTGDTNTGLYFPAADTVAIATGGTESARITNDGNLLVGAASNATGNPRLYVSGAFSMSGGSSIYWDGTLRQPTFTVAYDGGSSMDCLTIGSSANTSNTVGSYIRFLTGPSHAYSERARITSDGNLLVGYTGSNGGYKLQVNSQIFATSSTIATSDGRYKENITPIDGALNLVKELNPVQFSWKKHPVHAFDTETPTVGFIAQELQQVLADRPYLNGIVKCNECTITAAEYETIEIEPAEEEIKDENGNVLESAKPAITEQRLVKPAVTEKFLGIAEGNLIAILTKAIQEQQVIIESLTARITALEAK